MDQATGIQTVIKGGQVVDGTGQPSFDADIAIAGDKIVQVGGSIDAPGATVIDADGALVTPGWVDVHTHYDGQVTWDDELDPSFSNGVTSLVMGNCGVGFAPCAPGQQQTLIELMEGVEDIPGTALAEGVPWGAWESFPGYLDFLADRSFSLDVGAQVAHGALRFYVMGDRGSENQEATDGDIAEMRRLTQEAIAAGAVGVSTSRTIFHRSLDGRPVPGTYASINELTEIAHGMADGGGGVFEAITASSIGDLEQFGGEAFGPDHEMAMLAEISRLTGQNVTFTTVQNRDHPEAWRDILKLTEEYNAAGAALFPQVSSRPIGVLSGLSGYHGFMRRRSYLEIADLPVAERAARMRDPEVKARILADSSIPPENPGSMEALYEFLYMSIERLFPLHEGFDYEPTADKRFGAMAAQQGREVDELFYDFLCEGDGTNFASQMGAGYVDGNMDAIREMLTHPATVTGLADAGAHVKFICDGTMPTTQLAHWTRGRTRGEHIPLEFLVEKQTRRNARLYGMADRGTLEAGMRADINVIDRDNLTVSPPAAHRDLPAGGWRLLQPVTGYVATLCAGVQTRANDTDTGERPGRLIRSFATL